MSSKSYSESTPLQKVMQYNRGIRNFSQGQNTPKNQGSNTPKNQGNNTPRSKTPINPSKLQQELDQLNESGKSPTEFYKIKSDLLSQQITLVKEENEKLNKQCEHLRTLNFEYVKQLNEISASKLRAAEKIIITPEFFESETINQKVKDFMRKLANNYKLLEKEQTKLIDHCRVMEVDIENYRNKVIEADMITEKLKQTGQSSIDSLVQSLQDSANKVEDLTAKTKELGYELTLRNEKISKLEANIEDLNNEISDHKEEHQKLLGKYNRTVSMNEEKKNIDNKSVNFSQNLYDLQHKCNHLEHELRIMQGSLYQSNHQILDLDIQVKELSTMNESLSRNSSIAFSNGFRRNLSGTSPNVNFK